MSRFFLSVALVAALLSLAAAQSISFSQVASTSAFPPREYPACTQTAATPSSPTPTLYFFGGLNVTMTTASSNIATTGNSYTDGYYNDAWQSTNLGSSWSQLTASAPWAPQGWNGAITLSNGNIVFIGGGADSNSGENNQVWTTTTSAAGTFTQATAGPWAPRENFGFAGTFGTQNILIALGNTNNAESVDDIWFSTNGGQNWNQTCHYTSCPLVASAYPNLAPAGQVHGPTAVGLSTGIFLLMGGYGNDPSSTSNTSWVTNQVAISTNAFVTWSTFTAPWSPRAQQRAVVDADNFVYVYGGVYDYPVSGSSTSQYPNVASQAYYGYYQDLWYSTNAGAGAASTWTQITLSGISSAGYPGLPYSNNPNTGIPSSLYTNGAIFNPCLGVGYSSTGAKQLVLYTGLYAGYRQNQQAGQAVVYPGVYQGTLTGIASGNATVSNTSSSSTGTSGGSTTSSTGGNGAAATSAAGFAVAAVLAGVAMLL